MKKGWTTFAFVLFVAALSLGEFWGGNTQFVERR